MLRRKQSTGAAPDPLPTEPARLPPSSVLGPGVRIGRYEILEAIGSGSTATVYRALDRDLDRQISLKLLHVTSSDLSLQAEARELLLREAQALARLSHRNVVAAYDVGAHAGALFIAMEFIEGSSLRDWLAKPRGQAEVLSVLVAAGRGLAAAHEGGVLHRDFNPANVMVASDGRVRVVDFGVARASTAASEPVPRDLEMPSAVNAPSALRSTAVPGSNPVTRTAGIVGTPGFIAPEQWLGAGIDHRSDQFSFAVTAFVALTGQKPYPPMFEAAELSTSIRARMPWPRSVPRPLRRIVERGLSLRPEHRYPSLAVMVSALERFAWPGKRRSAWPAIAGALATSIAVPGALPKPAADASRCNLDDAALARVWNPSRRAQVEQAFRATGNNNAGDAFALVSERLDAFRTEWLAMRRDSCEATLVRGDQPERVMALRAACLDRALEGAKVLVAALAEVDAGAMNRVAEASPASLAECADAAVLLGSADQLPADPSVRASIEEVEVGLAVNQALLAAGRRSEAVDQAQRSLELARASNHLPTLAKATAQLGLAMTRTASTTEQRAAGEVALNDALRLAARAGDEQLLAHTASFLFYSIAYSQTRIQDGDAILPVVEALVQQAGAPPRSQIELALGKYTLLTRRNELAAAAEVLRDAIRIAEQNVGFEFLQFASLVSSELGFVYAYVGRFEEAVAMGQRGVDGARRLLGAHHPRMLNRLANLATLQAKAGRRDPALQTLAEYRALAATMPPQEPSLKYVPLTESRVWRITGDCTRAIPFQREALAKFSAADGPDHPLTTTVMLEFGHCLTATEQISEAVTILERVLANNRKRQDGAVPDAAFALAKALWQVPAQRQRARSLAEEARSLLPAEDPTGQRREAEQWLAAHPP